MYDQNVTRTKWIVTTVATLLCCGCGAAITPSAPASEPATDSATAQQLFVAIARRMTVWTRPDGTPVYARSCRQAPTGCEQRLETFARLIANAAARHDIDPFLLAALTMRESSFDPSATGRAGEAGIAQLHPRGEGHDVRYVQDRAYRRRCLRRVDACQQEVLERAADALRRARRRCGTMEGALAAYASGRCDRALSRAEAVMEERQRLIDELERAPASVAQR